MDTYALVQNGVVVNTVIANSTDPRDPAYSWIVVTGQTCSDGNPIQIGCGYDGSNFSTAPPPEVNPYG